MEAIILAAGLNKRFDGKIKCLLKVNGISFLENQLNLLSDKKKINKINIVVNSKDYNIVDIEISNIVERNFRLLNKVQIFNLSVNDVKKYNNWFSLKKVVNGINDDVLILNSDVWVNDCIYTGKKNLVYCIDEKFVEDESTKIIKRRCFDDSKNFITKLSKTIPKSKCDGEAVGVYFIKKDVLSYLNHELKLCHNNETFPMVINRLISYGHEFFDDWVEAMEVDDEKDFERLKKWLRR